MSSTSTIRGLANSAIRQITPECGKLAQSSKMVALTLIVVSVLVAIVLIVALIVHYTMKAKSTASKDDQLKIDERRKKVVVGLIAGSLFGVICSVFIGMWQLSIESKTIQLCL